MNFGLPELIRILLIVLLLFGSTRLPKLSRSIGESIKELREGFSSSSAGSTSKNKEAADKKTEDVEDIKDTKTKQQPEETENKEINETKAY